MSLRPILITRSPCLFQERRSSESRSDDSKSTHGSHACLVVPCPRRFVRDSSRLFLSNVSSQSVACPPPPPPQKKGKKKKGWTALRSSQALVLSAELQVRRFNYVTISPTQSVSALLQRTALAWCCGDFSAVPRSVTPRTLAMEPWSVGLSSRVETRLI